MNLRSAPQRPKSLSIFAEACLNAVADAGLGQHISLGGAFGLAHYFEYRVTHDVDAWWTATATRDARAEIVAILERTLSAYGETRTRIWGDVVSIELRQSGRTVFSFQIADRSALLREELVGVWPGDVRVDSFDDLVASKMAALVNRGAPRDFLDIYTLCQSKQLDAATCWRLWETRRQLAGEDTNLERAMLAVRSHLARIEATQPLDRIGDPQQLEQSKQLREWFVTEFLHGLD